MAGLGRYGYNEKECLGQDFDHEEKDWDGLERIGDLILG
tara:strand:- start:272 stop:388 length:117 start_codon:yes stop_codon:yes gene_type:complete